MLDIKEDPQAVRDFLENINKKIKDDYLLFCKILINVPF